MRRRFAAALLLWVIWAMSGCASTEPAAALELTVASYNLRLDLASDGRDAWPHRREAVKGLIRRHGFDVLGTQEGLARQIDDLAAMPGYAVVGVGRDDGRRGGEFAAIYFRSDRFDRLASGDFWLSQTPERPSKGWDARCCNRIATWVRLRDRATGRAFVVLSVHFDHEGAVARRESAALVLRRLREIAAGDPVICVGDFNATPESEPIALMTRELRDARVVAASAPAGPVGTFNGFRIDAPLTDRIDYVFVGPGWRVQHYVAIDDKADGRYPSDHLPVAARLRLQ
jgi:endonuclease/exonuclease/phosphatase family metal-dependent hydrolase